MTQPAAQRQPEPGDSSSMNSGNTDELDRLRAQVAHLNGILGRVQQWRTRAIDHVDENGLLDQHLLLTLDRTLAGRSAAAKAASIETAIDHDVVITRRDGIEVSTSAERGQTPALADIRWQANAGLKRRRILRTVTTITTDWTDVTTVSSEGGVVL